MKTRVCEKQKLQLKIQRVCAAVLLWPLRVLRSVPDVSDRCVRPVFCELVISKPNGPHARSCICKNQLIHPVD